MQRHVQTELARRFFEYLDGRSTHYARTEMEIPVEVYFDSEHAARERELIFRRQPIIVARSSEVAKPGDYVTGEIVGSPVLVVRQADGALKAFSNVCRHRGAKIVTDQSGCARRFRCPYHGWMYNTDGSLKSIPFGAGFDNLDPADHGLIELPADERHGMVWVTLTPGEPLDIAALIGEEMDRELQSFELDQFVLVKQATFDEPMNWKVIADGFLDPYHLQFVHPTTVGPLFNTNVYTLDVLAPHAARLVVSRRSMHEVKDQDPEQVDLLPHVICNYMLLPNTFVTVEPRHFEVWTISPHPTDPQRSTTTIRFLLRKPPADEREQSYLDKNWELLIHTVVDEDWGVGRELQKGLAHGLVRKTVAGRNEAPIQFVHGNLAAMMSENGEGAMAPPDEPYPRVYGNLVGEAV